LEDRNLRREDGVDQDMRISEVKNWTRAALNRDEWASFLRRRGPTKGCRANDDESVIRKVFESVPHERRSTVNATLIGLVF